MHVRLPARARRLAIVAAATFGLVVSATASPAFAAGNHHADAHGATRPATYLALGDSVPFGYRSSPFQPGTPGYALYYSNANFFVGYPELLAQEEHLRLLNASCPGETTDSFIDAGAQSNGCENSLGSPIGYRDNFPLHVRYESKTQSQLDYAIDQLQDKRNNVQLVTLMLGANDAFICQKTTPQQCTTQDEIAGVASHVYANLSRILAALRTEGGYTGKVVVVTYYALNYGDPSVVGTEILDKAITAAAQAHGDSVADGFAAFAPIAALANGDSRAAGLVRQAPDVHPTLFGQWVLSEAVERALPR